MKHAFLENP